VISLLLGEISARINNDLPKGRSVDDYLIFPIIAGGLSVAIAFGLHANLECPWLAVYLTPAIFLAGYIAGAPAFANSSAQFFYDRILPYPGLVVILLILLGAKIADQFKHHRRVLVFRALVVCLILSYGSMIYGWIFADLRFVAVGLGFLLGQIASSGSYDACGITRWTLTISCTISVFALASRVHEIASTTPMYAVIACLVALILTTLENPERRNCK
jgi:hypothetical protein